MADTDKYKQPPYVLSRVRYYDGEFLKDDDFIDEQKYHIDRRQRHERLLHTVGIAEGLEINAEQNAGKYRLWVAPGTAVDALGRQILLESTQFIPVDPSWVGTLTVAVRFQESEKDLREAGGSSGGSAPVTVQGHARFTQTPQLGAYPNAALPEHAVVLGQLSIATAGTAPTVTLTGRVYSGLRLPGPLTDEVGSILLRAKSDRPGWSELSSSLSVQKNAAVGGQLTVTGSTTLAAVKVQNELTLDGSLSFGSNARQMLNLYSDDYAIGVQQSTTYLRTLKNFAFFKAGVHSNFELDPGSGGTAMLVIKDGNVGIGTATPAARLHVTGDLALGLDRNNSKFFIHSRADNNGDYLQLTPDTATGTSNSPQGITLLRNGNVGIGKVDPQAKLHVDGAAAMEQSLVVKGTTQLNNLDVKGFSTFANNLTLDGILEFGPTMRQQISLRGVSHGLGVQAATVFFRTSKNFAFYKAGIYSTTDFDAGGGTTMMVIKDGKVGIGTAAPSYSLEVVGHTKLHESLTFGAKARQMINLFDDDYAIGIQTATVYFRSLKNFAFFQGGLHHDDEIVPGTGGKAVMVIKDGKVGIGQTDPKHPLHVSGNILANNVSLTSSRELKDDIRALSGTEALALFHGLKPVTFRFKSDTSKRLQAGFIAEEVPELVGAEDRRSILPSNIVAVLTRVVQVQQEAIEQLEQRIAAMSGGTPS
jgi:hypothetical protein